GSIGGKDDGPGLQYGGGYIQKMKGRDDDDFVWMSRVAGASVNRGVGVLGGRFTYAGLSFGGIGYYSDDIINIAYGRTTHKTTVAGLGLLASGQFTGQQSVGDNLLMGVPFSTNQLGFKVETSYRNAVLTFAYTHDAVGANIQTPWSGTPGYTSALVQNFRNAGEQAFLVKGSYDFSALGLSGLTAYAMYVHGCGTVNPATKASAPSD